MAAAAFSEPANAAAGAAWDPTQAAVFIEQGSPSTLYKAVTDGTGTTTFVAQGAASNFQYNAMGYDTVNNYLYGIAASAGTASDGATVAKGALIRIGQGGYTTVVGSNLFEPSYFVNVGAFNGANNILYVMGGDPNDTLIGINVTSGAQVSSVSLSGLPAAADFTSLGGYLWSFSGAQFSRINPATGAITYFPFTQSCPSAAGAAWTYGNGNLGFSCNGDGTVLQFSVANPGSASPTFTLVASNAGPANAFNDGAAIPGPQVDLGITKTGPASFLPGNQLAYSLKVTNNGTGASTGFVVTDTLPTGLTFVSASSSGCTGSGSKVTCVGGALAVGASQTFTITTKSASGMTACVTNTATVLGNENDPVSSNNSASATSCPAVISLVKTASVASYSASGQSITYTFTGTNTGGATLHNVQIAEGTFSGSGSMSALTCSPVQGSTLVSGATMVCTATYTTTQTDVDAGALANAASITGLDPLNETVTASDSVTVPAVQTKAITIKKSASLTTATAAGQVVTYSFLVTNTGNVTLTSVGVTDSAFSGTGTLSPISCPGTTLAPSAAMTCTATYAVTQADMNAGNPITNTATSHGTPPSGPAITSTPSNATVNVTQTPLITIKKSVSPTTVTVANQSVTYSFLVTNTGNVTLTSVGITETAFSGTGTLSAINCPGTSLAPTAAMTCTATYTVTQADRNAGKITNTATSHGTPPGRSTPVVSGPDSALVVIPAQPAVPPLPLTGGVGADTYLIAGGVLTVLSAGLGGLHYWRRRRT